MIRLLIACLCLFASLESLSQPANAEYILNDLGKIDCASSIQKKGYRDKLLCIQQTDSQISFIIFNVINRHIERQGAIRMESKSTLLDFCFDNSDIFLLYDGEVVKHNIINKNTNSCEISCDTCDFLDISILGNSLLLSAIYNYHPADGYPGLQLGVMTRDGKLKRQIFETFSGISISAISGQWVQNNDSEIFVTAPFAADITVYNRNLVVKKQYRDCVNLSNETSDNKAFVKRTDSAVWANFSRIRRNMGTHTSAELDSDASLTLSSINTKETIHGVIEKTRNNYSYVEKIIQTSDIELIFSVGRPGYGLEFRDVYKYNVRNGRLVDSAIKWRCGKAETVARIHDVFPIDLVNSRTFLAHFYEGHIYDCVPFSRISVVNGDIKMQKRKLSQIINNDKCSWNIIDYY